MGLRSSKPPCALAPPPSETDVHVDPPPKIGDVQGDECESSDASEDSRYSYYKPGWHLGAQHDSSAECDLADNEWYDL